MLYANETWPVTNEDFRRLERNDMMMIRWIYSAKLSVKVPSNELKERLHLIGVEDALQWERLRWYGHQRMEADAWPRKILNLNVTRKNSRGRPRKTWNECIKMTRRQGGSCQDWHRAEISADMQSSHGNRQEGWTTPGHGEQHTLNRAASILRFFGCTCPNEIENNRDRFLKT